jgi:hypothetical protein
LRWRFFHHVVVDGLYSSVATRTVIRVADELKGSDTVGCFRDPARQLLVELNQFFDSTAQPASQRTSL